MRVKKALTATVAAIIIGSASASAQYYEMANQLTNLISPALSGSLNYKGFLEFSGTAGVGSSRANFIGISTSQGFTYSSWFFMGAGIGIDVALAPDRDEPAPQPGYYNGVKTKAMMPIFSDFRFNIGSNPAATGFFIDIKLGAAWLLGNDLLDLGDSYMGNGAQFYLKPSLGMRIPVSRSNSSRAVNIGVTYQLLTSGNNYGYRGGDVTLSSIGASIAYEW